MSNQSKKVIDRLLASRSIVLPEMRHPNQHWIMLRKEPMDNKPGVFFITHAANLQKFLGRKGHFLVAHSYDRAALSEACNRATRICGPQYQPKHSTHAGPIWNPPEKPSLEEILGRDVHLLQPSPGGDDSSSPEGPDIVRNPSSLND